MLASVHQKMLQGCTLVDYVHLSIVVGPTDMGLLICGAGPWAQVAEMTYFMLLPGIHWWTMQALHIWLRGLLPCNFC